MKLMTPAGRPESMSNCMIFQLERYDALEGFQTTVFPIKAGAQDRLPAMLVKLKGVTARTNPSNGRTSLLFHTPGPLIGGCRSS